MAKGDTMHRSSSKWSAGFWENFKQQKSKAWVISYSAASVSPMLIIVGIILVPLGVTVLIITTDSAKDMKEYRIDYTDCKSVKDDSVTCANIIGSADRWDVESPEVCQCNVEFEMSKPMKGDKIYMYYRLENFYQNVRQYVKSRDDNQLSGKLGTADEPKEPSKDCEPFHKDAEGYFIFPCGALANSMFNDSIQLYYVDDMLGELEIKLKRKGIAWSTDKKFRYKNPPQFNNPNDSIWQVFKKPKDWSRTIWDLDTSDPDNNGVQNEDFIVWMRPAALPNLQKFYRIIESSSQDVVYNGLPAGKYKLKIDYSYEVASFGGRKGITLSVPTLLGQQNYFQGISAVSIGGIYIVTGLLLLLCGCSSRHGKGAFTKKNFDDDL